MTNAAIVLLLLTTTLQSQETKPVPKDSVEVEARGCLKGRVFTAIAPPEGEGVMRGPDITGLHFRVSGKREITDLVKKYNGQLVHIVGIVRKAALDDQGMGMNVGRGRVVIGAPVSDPTRMNAPSTAPSAPAMDVSVVRFLAERCPIG